MLWAECRGISSADSRSGFLYGNQQVADGIPGDPDVSAPEAAAA